MKKVSTIIIGLIIATGSFSQDLSKQLPKEKKYDPEKVVDEVYGIRLYEPLNMITRADSVRLCDGYACQGWVEDHYTNDELMHKGYYIDGQLKVYKNYYPSGQLEREFKTVDNYRSSATLYYPDGKVKSEISYINGAPRKWEDYYPDGTLKFYEEYHKSMAYHLARKSFYKNGNPESVLELEHKRKLRFTKDEYYESAQIKVDGAMMFDENTYDYFKHGKWLYYDESGNLKKEQEYNNGRISKEKTY